MDYNKLKEVHSIAVQEGQSCVQDEVDTHFIAFVLKDNHIYELDGCKFAPINHGESTQEEFLPNTCQLIKGFMDRDPEEIKFSLMVLAKNPEDK